MLQNYRELSEVEMAERKELTLNKAQERSNELYPEGSEEYQNARDRFMHSVNNTLYGMTVPPYEDMAVTIPEKAYVEGYKWAEENRYK